MFPSNEYLNNIMFSIMMFLFVTSTIITIPVMIYQYRKNGFLGFKRTFIIYLFVLYLQTIYLLAISPLPSRELIRSNPKDILDFVNLIPFSFISDIKLGLSKVSLTFMNLITLSSFYQLVFNIFMFIPLGIFLRNYFDLSLKKVVLYGFLGSMFIELTQLSGLYFIYPRPYRFFDIDDLIVNTTGVALGYIIAPLFRFMFPTIKEDLIKREEKLEVTMLPQYLMINLDLFITYFFSFSVAIIISLVDWAFNLGFVTDKITNITYLIMSSYILLLKPLISNNFQTPSMKIMKYDLYMKKDSKIKVLLRNFILYFPLLGFINILPFIYHLYFIIIIFKKKNQTILDKKLQIKYLKYYED